MALSYATFVPKGFYTMIDSDNQLARSVRHYSYRLEQCLEDAQKGLVASYDAKDAAQCVAFEEGIVILSTLLGNATTAEARIALEAKYPVQRATPVQIVESAVYGEEAWQAGYDNAVSNLAYQKFRVGDRVRGVSGKFGEFVGTVTRVGSENRLDVSAAGTRFGCDAGACAIIAPYAEDACPHCGRDLDEEPNSETCDEPEQHRRDASGVYRDNAQDGG